MFSTRTSWDRSPNRLATLLEAVRKREGTILDLTETNPTRVGLEYPEDRIREAMATGTTARYDPDPQGAFAARAAIGEVYGERGLRVDPERVFLTASTSEAYAWVFKLLGDPGDEILVPHPSYPLFDFLAHLDSVRPVPYPLLRDDGWAPDLAALRERIGARSRAIVLVSPNNPTGNYLKRGELEELGRLCRENGLALVGDEVFFEYPSGEDPRRSRSVIEAEGVLSFSLGGLSKLAGLPHLKLGWMALGGPEEPVRECRERLELVADTYLSVSSPVQNAAPELLKVGRSVRAAIQSRVRANRRTFIEAVSGQPACAAHPGEGGWSAVLQIPAVRSEEDWVASLLETDQVLVHPGYFFDFPSPAFLVLSLLPPEAVFAEALGRILARAGHL